MTDVLRRYRCGAVVKAADNGHLGYVLQVAGKPDEASVISGFSFGSTSVFNGIAYLLWAQPGLAAANVPEAKIKKC